MSSLRPHIKIGSLGPPLLPAVVLLLGLAIPILILTSNVRWAFNSPRLYNYSLERYDAQERTCLSGNCVPLQELKLSAREIIRYFNSNQEFLDIKVRTEKGLETLFNPREVLHMRDVKGLVRGFYKVQLASAIAVVSAISLGLFLGRKGFWGPLYRGILVGAGLTGVVVLILGVVALINFDWLFTQFHLASFSNLLWQLDPAKDRLTMMFPWQFWFDAALFLGGATLVESAMLALSAWGIAHWARGRMKRTLP